MKNYSKDYYSILHISPFATPEQIKAAYRTLAKKHHPDKGGDALKMQSINEAYDILGNSDEKTSYDLWYKLTYMPEPHISNKSSNTSSEASKHKYTDYYKPYTLTDDENECVREILKIKENNKKVVKKAILVGIKLAVYLIASIILSIKFKSIEFFALTAFGYSLISYFCMSVSNYVYEEGYDFPNAVIKSLPMFLGVPIGSALVYAILYCLIDLLKNTTLKSVLTTILTILLIIYLAVICIVIDIIKLITLLVVDYTRKKDYLYLSTLYHTDTKL